MFAFRWRIGHLILALTLIGAVLRLYNIDGTLQFLGDQGRDALIARRMLIDKDPVFIGPVTSVGNMYLGPAYYYFMLPFYALSYPSPMGPVIAVALIGILTIPTLYYLGKEVVGTRAALIATVLFTFWWTVIENTRFSWNPNPVPIVSIVMIWATYRAWKIHPRYWLIVSIAFSILIQLHYLTLLSLGAAGLVWIFSLAEHLRSAQLRQRLLAFAGWTVASIGMFLASLTPLVLFDIKHNFLNARAFGALLFGESDQVRGARSLFAILRETEGRSFHILFETLGLTYRPLNQLMLAIVVLVITYFIVTRKKRPHIRGEIVVMVWLLIGVIGTSLYRSSVFHHYIAFLFPVTALIVGMVLGEWWHRRMLRPIVLLIMSAVIVVNISSYRLWSLGWTIHDMQRVTESILDRVQPGEKYNIVLLAAHGDIDGMNYRYFLTVSDTPPLTQDRYGEAETLFIINEDRVLDRVVDSPVYEIVVFPDKNPAEVYTIENGPEISVLRKRE